MDLNRLYFEHQLALIRASGADGEAARDRHHARADCIASRISDFQDRVGARAVPLLPAEAF